MGCLAATRKRDGCQTLFADIHLEVIIDKAEGYAYLKQQQTEKEGGEATEPKEDTLKLINRRPLNFYVSLLCLLLRKHLVENDQKGDSVKSILSKEEIVASMSLYLKETTNEAHQLKQVEVPKAMIYRPVEKQFPCATRMRRIPLSPSL